MEGKCPTFILFLIIIVTRHIIIYIYIYVYVYGLFHSKLWQWCVFNLQLLLDRSIIL